MMLMSGNTQIPVRFKKGEKPSKSIKELKGTISAQVQMPTKPLITVDNIMKAAGQTVKGEKGGSVTVQEFAKQDNGQYKLRMQMEVPPDAAVGLNGAVQVFPGGGVQIQQIQVLGGGAPDTSALQLVDAKGQKFQQAGVSSVLNINNNVVSQEYTIMFQPEKDQGEPAKLIYSGSRLASIDLPFTLNDVPLP